MNIPGYTLERRIGSGGQAIVYEAVQDSLQRRVALKVLHPVHAGNPEFTERFLNEGRILASLGHSNAITIHDIGVVGELHYLSMELVEGGDLRGRIRQGLAPGDVLDYVAIIADCLGCAHARQVVHRDIKPANVLFRSDGTLLLTDFGIAKLLAADADLTLTGTTLGSPSYLSPEQARNLPVDGRADIYSLGVMTFEMLTGRKPFGGDSEFATIHHHLTSPVPELPATLAAYQPLVARMMAKSPDERFADTGQLIEALRTLRPQIPVQPRVQEPPGASGEAATGSAPTVLALAPYDETPIVQARGDDATILQVSDDGDATTVVNLRSPRPAASRRVPPLRAVVAVAGVAALAIGWLGLGGESHGVPGSAAPAVSATPSQPLPESAGMSGTQALGARGDAAAQPQPSRDAGAWPRAAPADAPAEIPPPAPASPLAALDAAPAATTREDRVQALLADARVALDDLRLTLPEANSALYFYDQVLAIEPHNDEARAGHRGIADRYADLARTALDRGETARARALVTRGLSVDGENARLRALSDEVAAARGTAEGARAVSTAGAGEIQGESPQQLLRRIKGWFD